MVVPVRVPIMLLLLAAVQYQCQLGDACGIPGDLIAIELHCGEDFAYLEWMSLAGKEEDIFIYTLQYNCTDSDGMEVNAGTATFGESAPFGQTYVYEIQELHSGLTCAIFGCYEDSFSNYYSFPRLNCTVQTIPDESSSILLPVPSSVIPSMTTSIITLSGAVQTTRFAMFTSLATLRETASDARQHSSSVSLYTNHNLISSTSVVTPQLQADNEGSASSPVVMVAVFTVLAALITIIIAGIVVVAMQQRSKRWRDLQKYSGIIYEEVDLNFHPVKVATSVPCAESLHSIFHTLEVENMQRIERTVVVSDANSDDDDIFTFATSKAKDGSAIKPDQTEKTDSYAQDSNDNTTESAENGTCKHEIEQSSRSSDYVSDTHVHADEIKSNTESFQSDISTTLTASNSGAICNSGYVSEISTQTPEKFDGICANYIRESPVRCNSDTIVHSESLMMQEHELSDKYETPIDGFMLSNSKSSSGGCTSSGGYVTATPTTVDTGLTAWSSCSLCTDTKDAPFEVQATIDANASIGKLHTASTNTEYVYYQEIPPQTLLSAPSPSSFGILDTSILCDTEECENDSTCHQLQSNSWDGVPFTLCRSQNIPITDANADADSGSRMDLPSALNEALLPGHVNLVFSACNQSPLQDKLGDVNSVSSHVFCHRCNSTVSDCSSGYVTNSSIDTHTVHTAGSSSGYIIGESDSVFLPSLVEENMSRTNSRSSSWTDEGDWEDHRELTTKPKDHAYLTDAPFVNPSIQECCTTFGVDLLPVTSAK